MLKIAIWMYLLSYGWTKPVTITEHPSYENGNKKSVDTKEGVTSKSKVTVVAKGCETRQKRSNCIDNDNDEEDNDECDNDECGPEISNSELNDKSSCDNCENSEPSNCERSSSIKSGDEASPSIQNVIGNGANSNSMPCEGCEDPTYDCEDNTNDIPAKDCKCLLDNSPCGEEANCDPPINEDVICNPPADASPESSSFDAHEHHHYHHHEPCCVSICHKHCHFHHHDHHHCHRHCLGCCCRCDNCKCRPVCSCCNDANNNCDTGVQRDTTANSTENLKDDSNIDNRNLTENDKDSKGNSEDTLTGKEDINNGSNSQNNSILDLLTDNSGSEKQRENNVDNADNSGNVNKSCVISDKRNWICCCCCCKKPRTTKSKKSHTRRKVKHRRKGS